MGDEARAEVLEWLSTRNVIVVVMTVDHVLDRLARNLFDFVDIGRDRLRTSEADGIGCDDTVRGDHEHRLVALVAKDIDVVGALDLGGGEGGWRGRRWRRLGQSQRMR